MKYYKRRNDGTYWMKTIEEIDLERIHIHLEKYGLVDKDVCIDYGDIKHAVLREDAWPGSTFGKHINTYRIARHIRYLLDQFVIHEGKIVPYHGTAKPAERFLITGEGSIVEAAKNPY